MIHLNLKFDIDFKRNAKEVVQVIEPLVDKLYQAYGSALVELDMIPGSPKLAQLLETIDEMHKRRLTRVRGHWLTERLVDDEETRSEWFLISPKAEFQTHWFGTAKKEWPVFNRLLFLGTEAQAYRPGVEIAGVDPRTAFSERAKAVVEQAGLTGVQFVWLADSSRYQARQWYLPVADRPLGRGVDHPWFDLRKRTTGMWAPQGHILHSLDRKWRRGISFFGGWQLKRGAGYGDPLWDRLLALFQNDQGIIESYRRVLRQYLPRTDFAYVWTNSDSPRWRGLCCNRKTRDLLVQARLLTKEEFSGIEVLDEPYRGAKILDQTCGGSEGPGPMYTSEELAEIRPELDRYWAKFMAKPKPVRKPSLPRSLNLLKARKADEPASFRKPVTRKALDRANTALSMTIPAAWQKVLQVSNGVTIENCAIACGAPCLIVPAEDLPEFHKEQMEIARSMDADLPRRCLHVVDDRLGDWVCLDLGKVADKGDCRVVLLSHETGEIDREWDNIATFLEDLLQTEA